MNAMKSEQSIMPFLLEDCNQPTVIIQNAFNFLKVKILSNADYVCKKWQNKETHFIPVSRIWRGSGIWGEIWEWMDV